MLEPVELILNNPIQPKPQKQIKPKTQSQPKDKTKPNGNQTDNTQPNKDNKTKLSPKAQKELGNLAQHADRKVADVLKERGGSGSNLNELPTGSGERLLGEVAEKAAKGDVTAKKIIKMVKQAKKKGQRY